MSWHLLQQRLHPNAYSFLTPKTKSKDTFTSHGKNYMQKAHSFSQKRQLQSAHSSLTVNITSKGTLFPHGQK